MPDRKKITSLVRSNIVFLILFFKLKFNFKVEILDWRNLPGRLKIFHSYIYFSATPRITFLKFNIFWLFKIILKKQVKIHRYLHDE